MKSINLKWIDDTNVQISSPDGPINLTLGGNVRVIIPTAPTFPTATTVGPKAGTVYTDMTGPVHLWSGGLHSLKNVRLNGSVLVQMDGAVIDNCIITNNDGGAQAVVRVDTSMTKGTGLQVTNSVIDGAGITVNGISGNGLIQNNLIKGVENGLNIYGGVVTNILGNFILITQTNGAAPHYDGIENNGASNVTIKGNTVINKNAQTSALMLNNYFDGLSNIDISDNYFEGGGYTIYVDNTKSTAKVDASTIKIQNNTLKKGLYGHFALYTSGVVPANNTLI